MHCVSLARLGWTKEDDATVFALDEGLDDRFDTLAVEFVLASCIAEDRIEVEHVCIVAI